MGAKKQTLGYHYLFTILFEMCRGPVNVLKEIRVGDKVAWGGNKCAGDATPINAPNLFGGEKKEGGIQGAFNLNFGELDQVLPGPTVVTGIGSSGPVKSTRLMDVHEILPGRVSQLRGITTLLYDGLISSMNPYPKEWKFRMARSTAGWSGDPWYPEKATIWLTAQDGSSIWAMNPAHMIYQCLTDVDWGGAEDVDEIDANSFVVAANTLCNEGFGMCYKWERKEDIDAFIKRILDHIGAALYTDRQTGLLTLKLIRNDYVVADLPLFTADSGLLEITEDDSEAVADAINEVIATGADPSDTGNDFQVRVQNIAGIQAVGGRVTSAVEYKGIPTRPLLLRVAQRDLKATSLGLKRFTLKMDRRAWRIYPAMPFRVSDSRNGIGEIVVRAAEIDDSSDMEDGFINIKVVEDVFQMPTTSFVEVPEPGWTPPPTDAVNPPDEKLFEAGYRDIYLKQGAADADAMAPTDGLIGVVAASPDPSMTEYDLATRVYPDEFTTKISGFFTDYGRLVTALGYYDTTMKLNNLTAGFVPTEVVGTALLIGDEVIGVDSYDPVEDEFTISRGTADTLPQIHAVAARAWTIDDDTTSDEVLYQIGETVDAKVLTKTSSDILEIADATTMSIEIVGRQAKPYPPANLKMDGTLIYETGGLHVEPVFTWAHRDRKLEFDSLVDHQEASIGPEAGTTYTFRVYDQVTDDLLGTYADIDADTWTYDSTMQAADGAGGSVRMEFESVRDGLPSWQKYSFTVSFTGGYGYGYGLNYGGGA